MPDVTLTIGDRRHSVACRDGEEDQLLRLGTMLDQRWSAAERASGGLNGERSMLFVALMLADALDEAERNPSAGVSSVLIGRLADRLEAIAAKLEDSPATA